MNKEIIKMIDLRGYRKVTYPLNMNVSLKGSNISIPKSHETPLSQRCYQVVG